MKEIFEDHKKTYLIFFDFRLKYEQLDIDDVDSENIPKYYKISRSL